MQNRCSANIIQTHSHVVSNYFCITSICSTCLILLSLPCTEKHEPWAFSFIWQRKFYSSSTWVRAAVYIWAIKNQHNYHLQASFTFQRVCFKNICKCEWYYRESFKTTLKLSGTEPSCDLVCWNNVALFAVESQEHIVSESLSEQQDILSILQTII